MFSELLDMLEHRICTYVYIHTAGRQADTDAFDIIWRTQVQCHVPAGLPLLESKYNGFGVAYKQPSLRELQENEDNKKEYCKQQFDSRSLKKTQLRFDSLHHCWKWHAFE